MRTNISPTKAEKSTRRTKEVRPVVLGTLYLKIVFRGGIIILSWTLTGLVFEAVKMGQLFTNFSKVRPNTS